MRHPIIQLWVARLLGAHRVWSLPGRGKEMVSRSGGLWTPTLLTLLHPDGFLTGLEEAETFHRDAISGSEEQRTSPKHPPGPPTLASVMPPWQQQPNRRWGWGVPAWRADLMG